MSAPSLELLTQAMEHADGKTPSEVLDAFLPDAIKISGIALVPVSAGHDLFLSKIGHPLATRQPWQAHDVAVGLFVLSRKSSELFPLLAADAFEDELYRFLDEVRIGALDAAATAMVAHWIKSRATVCPMGLPEHAGSKKKRGSAGGCKS